jgi:hypothetical protein
MIEMKAISIDVIQKWKIQEGDVLPSKRKVAPFLKK